MISRCKPCWVRSVTVWNGKSVSKDWTTRLLLRFSTWCGGWKHQIGTSCTTISPSGLATLKKQYSKYGCQIRDNFLWYPWDSHLLEVRVSNDTNDSTSTNKIIMKHRIWLVNTSCPQFAIKNYLRILTHYHTFVLFSLFRHLFWDLLPQIGSNSSVIFIKDLIKTGKVRGYIAQRLLSTFPFYLRHPTEELLAQCEVGNLDTCIILSVLL